MKKLGRKEARRRQVASCGPDLGADLAVHGLELQLQAPEGADGGGVDVVDAGGVDVERGLVEWR